MAEIVDFEEGKRKREQRTEEEPPRRKVEPWEAALKQTRWGETTPTLANAALILSRAEGWRGVLSWNAFAGRIQVMRPPPSHAIDAPSGGLKIEWWSDDLAALTRAWLERMYDVAFAKDIVHEAARIAAGTMTRHPLQDYLRGLIWDGKERVDTWLVDFVQVKDSPYVRTVGAKWLLSAVARALEPGCKVDYALVLEGEQRAGKSSVCRALCPDERWFLSTDVELGHKDSYHVIANKWIVELRELGSLSRGDYDRVKGFMSTQIDSYCPRYGRVAIDQPRTCVMIGSVNPPYNYLKDESGGDRWWPIRTQATYEKQIDVGAIEAVRDQLWAEVVHRYKAGEKWHIVEETSIRLARAEQEARREEDPLEAKLRPFLASQKRREKGVTVAELLEPVLGEAGALRATKADSMRIARALQALGWGVGERMSLGDKRIKVYRPKVGLKEIK